MHGVEVTRQYTVFESYTVRPKVCGRLNVTLGEHPVPDLVPLCRYTNLHSSGKDFRLDFGVRLSVGVRARSAARAPARSGTDVGRGGVTCVIRSPL